MRESVDGDVQGQLLAIFGADAFAIVAGVVGAEGAAEAVFTHDRHEITLVKKAFELDVTRFVQTADAVDFVKRAIDQMVVRDGFDFFIRENAAELAPPGARKFRIGAAAGSEKEAAMTEIFPQIFELGF